MINKDRIVSILKTDLLSLVGTILGLIGTSYAVIKSSDVEGTFAVTGTGAAGNKLADQPLKTCDFGENVTSGTVFFVAAYDYAGFTIDGAAATMGDGSVTVNPDGATLYKAVLGSNKVTVSAITPIAE